MHIGGRFIFSSLSYTVFAFFHIKPKAFLYAAVVLKLLCQSLQARPVCVNKLDRWNSTHYVGQRSFSGILSVCQICCVSVSANSVVSSSAHMQTIVFSCFLFAAGVRRESTVSVANLFVLCFTSDCWEGWELMDFDVYDIGLDLSIF